MSEGEVVTEFPPPEVFNRFAGELHLGAIELDELSVRRLDDGIHSSNDVDIKTAYALLEGRVQYRFELELRLLDEAKRELAHLKAAMIAAFLIPGEVGPPEVYELFGATSAVLAVYPYLRELVENTCYRMGYPNVVLPLIRLEPNGMTPEAE